MAAVKTLSRTIVDALGVPLVGKTATLKNNATGATIASTTTDANGVYSFPDRDETLRYRVEVSPGGASTQVYRASPADAEFGHLYAMDSLRTAAGAVVAFGGAVTVGGAMTVGGMLQQSGGYAYLGAYNSGTIRPRSFVGGIGDLAISWNYSLGAREIAFWNTDITPAVTSFSFKQLTGASAHTDLLTLNASGLMTVAGAVVVQPATSAVPSLRAIQHVSAASTATFAAFELSGGQTAWGMRGDGIVCDVAATSISLGPSPTRMLRVWNTAGTLLGYIPIHPGA